ncbi:BREX-1 system adenine-specific DNA-methyltransferase PglX [Peribacillus frigoritolerans]
MNKTELKNFAIQSRRQLIDQVKTKALMYGIDEKNDLEIQEQFGQLMINDKPYPLYMKPAFNSLKNQLKQKGYKQLVEEVAYTWFNRIIAIRYMEVHDYLPEKVNVLSSSIGRVDPDILFEYETMDLFVKQEEIRELLHAGDTEGAFRKLFIAQCNALNSILPFLFEQIQDYTELLLPDFLLDAESVIKVLVQNNELTNSFDEIEVIGWLYQYYISEEKDRVFANLKKNKKIDKQDIPAATQLFTPKWIVKYMVENSLGQLWLEANPNSLIKEKMKHYIEPVEQDKEIKVKLESIRYKNVDIEKLKIIDPCVGSGHILVYAFDLLYQMYEESGYPNTDIPQLILENNLYGLDVDDRAVQLANFSLIMKARAKSKRMFRKKIVLNIHSIQESNIIDVDGFTSLICKSAEEKLEIKELISTYSDAKNRGTTIIPPTLNTEKYLERISRLENIQLSIDNYQHLEHTEHFKRILNINQILSGKYDITITNPPYMGFNGMNLSLKEYLQLNFPKTKNDLCTVLMEQGMNLTKENGFLSMINITSWMFLLSYADLRYEIIQNKLVHNLLHLGRGIFGSDHGTVTFILRNSSLKNYKATYKRLIDKKGAVDTISIKEKKFFEMKKNYYVYQERYLKISGYPFAYWASEKNIDIFEKNLKIGDVAEPRQGLATGDNKRFLRFWYEVAISKIGFNFSNISDTIGSNYKWFPYNKGGDFRKWYGNQEYIVNWQNNGEEIRAIKGSNGKVKSRVQNTNYYFKEGITWTLLSSSKFGVRYIPKGFIFDINGMTMFVDPHELMYLLGLMCSKVTFEHLEILNPTMAFQIGDIKRLPVIYGNQNTISKIVDENIELSKIDWDLFETSWNFKKHALLVSSDYLEENHSRFLEFTQKNRSILKQNEELLNEMFIEVFGLENQLDYQIEEEDITLYIPNKLEDAKSLLSYFIGCLVGRYSLDNEGVVYAGGTWDDSKYTSFKPNQYGIINFTDAAYFENDIIKRLNEFLSVAFSSATVDENIQWIAESLGMKPNEHSETRLRRYFMEEFFVEHCKMYQKQPIYWLVDSGKQNGLRTLIYMHRYKPDTISTIRFEHLQEIQAKYQNEINDLENRLVNPSLSASEKKKLTAEKTSFEKKMDELREFDKRLAEIANEEIEIDLDDGVKVNYEKFYRGGKGVLAKIK